MPQPGPKNTAPTRCPENAAFHKLVSLQTSKTREARMRAQRRRGPGLGCARGPPAAHCLPSTALVLDSGIQTSRLHPSRVFLQSRPCGYTRDPRPSKSGVRPELRREDANTSHARRKGPYTRPALGLEGHSCRPSCPPGPTMCPPIPLTGSEEPVPCGRQPLSLLSPSLLSSHTADTEANGVLRILPWG